MPNYVANMIDFSNMDKVVFDRICAFINTEKELGEKGSPFDFNRLIPMPESLAVECGSNTICGKELALIVDGGNNFDENQQYDSAGLLHLLKEEDIIPETRTFFTGAEVKRFTQKTEKGQSLLKLGRAVIQNLQQYGAETWYDWRIAHWGTKWNAVDVSIDADSQQIRFDTAWSFPEPIAYALVEKFSESEFVWKYADEDCGCNAGRFENANGETYLDRYKSCSDEAYECYVSLWGETSCFGKDEDGHWISYDCDTCPNADQCQG